MTQQNSGAAEQLTELLQVAVQKLAKKTMQRLLNNPEALASALAAAATVIDADASMSNLDPAVERVGNVTPLKRISAEAAEAELRQRTVQDDVGELLTSEAFAERAGIKSGLELG